MTTAAHTIRTIRNLNRKAIDSVRAGYLDRADEYVETAYGEADATESLFPPDLFVLVLAEIDAVSDQVFSASQDARAVRASEGAFVSV